MKKLLIFISILFFFTLLPIQAQINEDSLYSAALTKIQNQDYTGAKEDLDKLIELNPDNPDYYYAMSYIFETSNDFETAKKYLDKTIELTYNYMDTYYNRAILNYKQDKKQEALKDLNTLLSINPYYNKAFFIRGKIYQDLGDLQSALKDYNKYLNTMDEEFFPEVLFKMGDIFYLLDRYEDAISSYKKIVYYYKEMLDDNNKKDSKNIEEYLIIAYNQLAISQKELKQYQEAISNLNTALSFNNKKYEYGLYCNRGEMYFFLKKYEDALKDLNKTIEIDPTFAEAYYYRSLVHNALGKKQESQNDLQKAKDLGFTDEDIAKNPPPKDLFKIFRNVFLLIIYISVLVFILKKVK